MTAEALAETPNGGADPLAKLSELYLRCGGEEIDDKTYSVRTKIQSLLDRITGTLKLSLLKDNRFPANILAIQRIQTVDAANVSWVVTIELLQGNPLHTIAQNTKGVTQLSITLSFGVAYGEQLTEDDLLSAILEACIKANQIDSDSSTILLMSQVVFSTNGNH